ncbi:MAG TPA: ATP-binding protein [Gaiellaceae bacterium]|nr:ATP-binding protein [Gaiellaceae bacterium]
MAPTRETRLEAFTRLARIGASRGDDVHALLHEACELAVAKLGLDRCVVYRLLASDEIVPVVTCGEPALEHVGGGVGTLADRPLFRRAVEAAETVVVSGPGEDPILQAEGTTVIAPMLGRDGCLGFLAGTDGDLAPDHVAEIRAYADLVAAFLERGLEQERLTRLGDLKSHFIALASHELRAPVAVIHGIGVTLNTRRERLELEEVARLHGVLNEQTEHLASLVNQLLDLSRLEADAIELRRQEVVVRELVDKIVTSVAADQKDAIAVEVEPKLRARVDPNAFERIVANLIANAVRYGAAPVRVTAAQRDTHFRLTVEDRGPGVGKDFVPRLFERFARGRHSAERAAGSGLGLAIAQAFAHAHGGELMYTDAEPHGARFELVLPHPALD